MDSLLWQRYFQPQILERGKEYAHHGLVTELSAGEGTISAVVKGSEPYNVKIEHADEKLLSAHCDCPYAEGGAYCKHMAAVLYTWEKGYATVDYSRAALEAAINAMSTDELRGLLMNAALKDSTLAEQICSSEKMFISAYSPWENEIDDAANRYENDDGYVDYYHAWGYMEAIADILRQYKDLLAAEAPEEAFELTCKVYDEICSVEIDDSDGQLSILLSDCFDAWDDILDEANDRLKSKMHDWFIEQWENETCWDYQLLSKYVFDTDSSENAVRRSLTHIDRKIANCKEYELDSLLHQKLELLEKLSDSEDALAVFFEQYSDNSCVRAMFAERMLKSGDSVGAIALLRQNKADHNDRYYYASLASEKLIEIFGQAGDTEKLTAELMEQVMRFRQDDLRYVEQLKELLTEKNWAKLREKLIGKLDFQLGNRFLFTEGLLRRLLDRILKAESVYEMDAYADRLRGDYSDEIRNFYCAYLQKSVRRASDRNMYRRLIPYLYRLSDYEGGREMAVQLVSAWKQEYKRRTAMMDELKKAGY